MKKYLVLGLGAVFSVAFAGTAMAAHTTTTAGDFANGIGGSRHNLSTSGSHLTTWDRAVDATRVNSAGTSEMCVFCHTPHFTNKATGPLWNRNSMSTATVTNYGRTIAGNDDGASNMFSTLACLTCHDGVTTFDNLVNRPGKGLGSGGTAAGTRAWNFVEAGTDVSDYVPFGRLSIGDPTVDGTGGKNLSNDHPIGVVYRGAGQAGQSASLRARTTLISGIDLSIPQEGSATNMAPLVTGNLWAVKGFISDSATIDDLLRSGNGSNAADYVQCASCHDLHYKNLTNPEADYVSTYTTTGDHEDKASDGLFLRRVGGNSDSGLCRTCHNK